MVQQNRQEKSIFFSPSILILATDPSKENIVKVARECISECGCLSREEALALIEALHEAEAKNTRGVGDEVERLIVTAEENLRSQARAAG